MARLAKTNWAQVLLVVTEVNPYVGFEMGYDWLGRMPYKGDNINGAYKAQGVQLTAKLGYPITDDLDVYTRLRLVWYGVQTPSLTSASTKDHDTGVSPFAGGIGNAITLKSQPVWNTSGLTASVMPTPSAPVRTTAC